MKRFSAREFALLCVPVATVAGAGWWASRRGPLPASDDGKPKLVFRVEQPTTLKAFDGVKAIVVGSVTPDATQFLRRTDYCLGIALHSDSWIDVKTPQGTKTWNRSAKGAFASDAFDEWYNCDYYLALKQVPQGEITLRFKDSYLPSGAALNRAKAVPVQGKWMIDKSLIQPFDFSLPQTPEVELRSVRVSDVRKSGVDIACNFVLTGKNAGRKTTFDKQATMSSDWSVLTFWGNSEKTMTERTVTFGLSNSGTRKGKIPKFTVLTGRVSANNNWPLAFKSEPFEFRKVKIDQQLKFKSWPAPLPPNAGK